MMDMKTSCVITFWHLMFSPLAMFGALSVQLPALSRMELPNSEVAANVAFNEDYTRVENLTFSLVG